MGSKRTLAVLLAAALAVGLVGVPVAEAGKKKKKKCAPFAAPEGSAVEETTIVTDAATEEAPVEVTVPTGPGLGLGRDPEGEGMFVSQAFVPVQVDSKASGAGLYGMVEFTPAWDYDLYLDDAFGNEMMASGGFFVIDDAELGGNADNSATGAGFEAIYGATTADCDGFVFDVVGATTPGEDVTLKLWLGEATF